MITPEELEELCRLARIGLSPREREEAAEALDALEALCARLPEEADTMEQPGRIPLPLRQDKPAPFLTLEELMANVPRREGDCICAGRAFGEEGEQLADKTVAQAADNGAKATTQASAYADQGTGNADKTVSKTADYAAQIPEFLESAEGSGFVPSSCPGDRPSYYQPLSLVELSHRLETGASTSLAITEACLARSEALNPTLHIWIELFREEALSAAAAADERRSAGHPLSPWDGIPFALKDNFCYQGHLCECAGYMGEGFRSPYTATAVERLLSAGMIPLGRVNMDEFAMGSHCSYSRFGATKNPLDVRLSPGGSSGGSAAAVACGMVPLALGSDTGGSVRLPGAYCGVCGVKPAYGSISRRGLVAFASSLDTVGLLAAEPRDCEAILPLLMGKDGYDSTLASGLWREEPLPTLAWVWRASCTPPVEAALELTLKRLSALGIRTGNVPPPDGEAALCAYNVLSSAEAYSNLARFDGLRFGHRSEEDTWEASRGEGFGPEVKRRLLMGTWVLSHPGLIHRALACRQLLSLSMGALVIKGRVLLSPCSDSLPPKSDAFIHHPTGAWHSDILTVPASLSGFPSVCFPVKTSPEAFPVGICLTGSRGSLRALLELAQKLRG